MAIVATAASAALATFSNIDAATEDDHVRFETQRSLRAPEISVGLADIDSPKPRNNPIIPVEIMSKGHELNANENYWIEGHPTKVYALGTLVRRKEESGELVLRSDEDDEEVTVAAPGHVVHPSALEYLPDLMTLGEFSEACLLHTIRSRFTDQSKFYTQIGTAILVAFNPYKECKELYSAKMAKIY